MFLNPEHAFGGSETMLSLVGMIYQAIEEPELWPTVIETFTATVGGEATVMLTNYGKETNMDICATAGVESAFIQKYVEHYSRVNIWTEPCKRLFPVGTVSYSHRAVSDARFQSSEWYNDFLKPHGLYHAFGLQIPMRDGYPVTVTTLAPKRRRRFDEREATVLETLMPHLSRALSLHVRLSQMNTSVRGLLAAFDSFCQAVFGLTGTAEVLFRNSAGEHLVSSIGPLSLKGNRLSLCHAQEDAKLQKLMQECVLRSSAAATSAGGLLVVHDLGGAPLRIVVMPFLADQGIATRSLAGLVMVNGPLIASASRTDLLRHIYGLTASESKIVEMITQGIEAKKIANQLHVSHEAVRFHLKNAFRKTGVNRQIDLVRLVFRLPGKLDIKS